MDTHELPPLKRFRLMHQQQQQHEKPETRIESSSVPSMVSSNLPAKKRREPRDSTQTTTTTTMNVATAKTTTPISSYALPTKKRVWAFAPDEDIDLNVEYKPSSQFNEKDQQTPLKDPNLSKIEPFVITQLPVLIEKSEKTAANFDAVSVANQPIEEVDDDDDGIVCAVCQSGDADPTDPIVLCDGCDLMVHSSCYGNPLRNAIPEGDWFCFQCLSKRENPKLPISCCLCPSTEGAMKATNDGRWAHVVCALLVPEVFFQDPAGRDGIDCSKVGLKRWEGRCYVCGFGNNGCVVDCSEAKCCLAFHVTCGLKEELAFEYNEGRKKGAVVAGFCKDHTKLWKKQQLTGKFKIVAREEHNGI